MTVLQVDKENKSNGLMPNIWWNLV